MQKSMCCLLSIMFLMAVMSSMALGQTNERGIDPANFDTAFAPCDNFYQYANGNWLKNNPIPAEYSSWSISHEIFERNNDIIHTILDETAHDSKAEYGTNKQRIGDFYRVAMDTARIEAEGLSPIKNDLFRIDAISSIEDIQNIIIDFHREGMSFLFDADPEQDMADNTKIIIYAGQSGLGLPDRDYYTRDDAESVKLREEYINHITNMMKLIGYDEQNAKTQAETILALETRLANASLTNVELRDPAGWYKIKTIAEANEETPNFDWGKYFAGQGLANIESFSYAHPKFFAEMGLMLKEIPIESWKSYLRWHFISRSAAYLSSDFVNENFKFYSTTLSGTQELRPRWKRVLRVIDAFLGEAMGQLYVERTFPPESKARALEMVNNLLEALKDRINGLSWMSDETKEKALAKVAAITPKIGYPDKWRDYANLAIDETNSYLTNARMGRAFERQRNLDKIGKPVDKTEWGMNPQEVNAYYNPLKNEIVFPAAILQPPAFDGAIDDAVNYGAIGAVIGHEMTHGFDDMGSQFDADGNFNNWWTEDDRAQFESRTDRIIKQFDNYVAIDSLHINGALTVGENIADLGGLIIAYNALEKALEGKPRDKIDGFTPEQRFFLSFAQMWRTNDRDEGLKMQVNTDPHSPAQYRVLGPLSNLKEFREAFNCSDGDNMVRPDSLQVNIW
ncbi:MAG: M13 family metallopeptidase [Candidatus Zixiibacteriota bacterium]